MKPLRFFYRYLLALPAIACVVISGHVKAQGVLQVATKTIEKTISPKVRTLYITAEKADIEMTTWNKSEITIVLELSARHPDKNTAAADLSKVQYIADRNGKDYFLR